jgi:hypothetical protein
MAYTVYNTVHDVKIFLWVLLGKGKRSLASGLPGPSGFSGKLFGELEGVHGVFVRLFAELMSGQMISLAVGDGSSVVGVGREVVEFCHSVVGAL